MKAIQLPIGLAQKAYVKTLRSNLKPLVVATGPAGSGKTLFACQTAVENLADKRCERIILTRPIVSVDEELGFLPGNIDEKMDPWTRPMFDILSNYYSKSQITQMVKNKTVEISPLAYMRGRTFEDSFIIGDEMQNATPNQMKMMLTRLGENSKMVITGDADQCDIPKSGLVDLIHRMSDRELEYLDHIVLGVEDIQRHPAIKEILSIYIS
jgi:phosphate starvation-inducible PhoH-like protein